MGLGLYRIKQVINKAAKKNHFLPVYYFFLDLIHRIENKWWLIPSNFGYLDRNCLMEKPTVIVQPNLVYLEKGTNLRQFAKIINSPGYKFIMKKYSVCAFGLTVVTGNHRAIVGLPQFLSGSKHIRDSEMDIILEEGVWCGANVTLLYGAHIGRGSIIGAGCIVNKEIPPYAVAVGSPAKIVASVFSVDQILRHEALIYPPEERFSREYLEDIFAKYYQGKKTVGLDIDLTPDEMQRLSEWDERYDLHIITPDYPERIKKGRNGTIN